jgi:hypothetical protein
MPATSCGLFLHTFVKLTSSLGALRAIAMVGALSSDHEMNVTPELVLSMLALGCSIYAILQTRKYNLLSQMPHLELPVDKDRSDEGIKLSLKLRNTGLGPAIILDRWYSFSDQRYQSKLADPAEELAAHCFAGKVPYKLRRHGLPGIGCIMPAGGEMCIYEIFFPGLKREQEEAVSKLAAHIDFQGRYRYIHGDTFSFTTNDKVTVPGIQPPVAGQKANTGAAC